MAYNSMLGHVRDRLYERYNVKLSYKEILELNDRAQNGELKLIGSLDDKRVSVFIENIKGHFVYLMFDKDRQSLITVYTGTMISDWVYKKKLDLFLNQTEKECITV